MLTLLPSEIELLFGDRPIKGPGCKGVVVRYTKEAFRTARGYATMERFNILNRKSCPGCNHCFGLRDAIDESIADGYEIQAMFPLEHGDVAELVFVPDGYESIEGHSTNVVDEFHIAARKLKEESK